MENTTATTIVHCPECQAANRKQAWEFRGCGDGPAQTQCWNWMAGCEAWFDPNWEMDLAIGNQIARDELRAECHPELNTFERLGRITQMRRNTQRPNNLF